MWLRLSRADLGAAILQEANFFAADIQGASLTVADLRHASFVGANLQKTQLKSAKLQGADLSFANLRNATDIDTARFDEKSRLPDGTMWSPDTNVTVFTLPDWEPENPDTRKS
jgi:uncharacterized protein YjbI with pentapeptide repeats